SSQSFRIRCRTTFFSFCSLRYAALIYSLSLRDALPISAIEYVMCAVSTARFDGVVLPRSAAWLVPKFATNRDVSQAARISAPARSEEHTSELQSLRHLVCRLLREKKKARRKTPDRRHRQ